MISHQVWMSFPETDGRAASALLGLAVLVLFFTLSIPAALWIAVLSAVFASQSVFKSLLNSAPLQFLGRVSYSTYLGHMLVLWGLQALIFRLVPSVTAPQMLVVLVVAALPLTLVLSALLHRWVEKPAIRFGRQLFQRRGEPSAAASPA
jgi:peptidoglycan/LPS O-acetylase OafA/YrhL